MRYRPMIFSLTLVVAACGGDTGADTTTSAPETTTTTQVTTTTEATTTSTTTTTTLPPTTTTTTPTTTTEPLPELTQEIAGERLQTLSGDLLQAFLDQDEEAYAAIDTALRDEVRLLLAEHAPLSAVQGSWEEILQDLGTEGVSHRESLTSDEIFWHPANTLFELYRLGVPQAPFVLYTGVYTVDEVGSGNPNVDDDATVSPGTYVAFDVEGCYWERLDQTGEIHDNNFVNAAPRVEVSIRSTDFAFNSEDCAPWVRVGG